MSKANKLNQILLQLWKSSNPQERLTCTERQRAARFRSLRKYLTEHINDLRTTRDTDWFPGFFQRVDRLFWRSLLQVGIDATFPKGIVFRRAIYTHDEENAAWIEVEYSTSGKPDTMIFLVNQHIFSRLFQKQEQAYQSGGLLCVDQIDCLLNVLVHETVHVYFTILEERGLYDDSDFHGPHFQEFNKRLFGQTHVQHGLLPGLDHPHDYETVKSLLRRGEKLKVYQTQTQSWVIGEVTDPVPDAHDRIGVRVFGIPVRVHVGTVEPDTCSCHRKKD